MAVLWDRMVFSFSSYSWKMSGLRAFLGSARGQVSVTNELVRFISTRGRMCRGWHVG